MTTRFEAEEIVRAAASGAIPTPGDTLVRVQEGWIFSPLAGGGGGGGPLVFSAISGSILDEQVPVSAVVQHNAALDHGVLAGLTDDDHLQYLLLLGRAGGQSAFGSPISGEDLTLAGNPGANPGFVRVNSPIIFGAYSANPAATYAMSYTEVETFTAPFIGGGLNFSGTIAFTNSTFIYESYRGAPTITTGVIPGFAAYTVMQGIPILAAGPGLGQNPLNVLMMNCSPTVVNSLSGFRTTNTVTGISFAAQVRATLLGAVMTVTNMSATQLLPSYSTVGGSTANFGTIRGLWARNPNVGLFQPSGGTETMAAYYGLDVDAIPFGGNVPKAAVRSAIAAASNARFLLNTGTAESDFGVGHIHFNNQTIVKFGNTVAAPDMQLFWDNLTAEFRFSVASGTGGNPLALVGSAADEWIFRGGAALDIGMQFNVNAISFGTALPTPNSNNWFAIFSAPNLRQPAVAGEYSDVLWTAGGSIDVDGLAITNLQAFKINTPAVVLNGGTIQDFSNLFIDSMASFGGVRHQAFRVTGRTRLDGLLCHNEATLATLTADVVALALPANNIGRFVLLEDADALGPWAIQGIVNVQVGDAVYIVNTGANAFDLNHQDAAAAAANRIISPTGANLNLAQDEMAKLWYDPVAIRWRILEHTGT